MRRGTVWLAACLWLSCGHAAQLAPYLPNAVGSRLSYRTTTTLDPQVRLNWDLNVLKVEDLADGAERVTLRARAGLTVDGEAVAREEALVRESRGVFSDGADGDWGPAPLLLAAPELEQADAVWSYEGRRPLPFALAVLRLLRKNDGPVAASGHYHVLNLSPVEVPAGNYPRAVQVTGVEQVQLALRGDRPEPVMLRSRRWYVRGLGLVRELVEFAEYPSLGRLTTELTSFAGLRPEAVEGEGR